MDKESKKKEDGAGDKAAKVKLARLAKLLNKHRLSNTGIDSLVLQMLERPDLMKHGDFPHILKAINLIYEGEKRFIRLDKRADVPLMVLKGSSND